MRISTGMVFDANVRSMQSQTAALYKTNQEISTGKRVLTPSDDPVNAAQALTVTQRTEVLAQYKTNFDSISSALNQEDAQLKAVDNLFGEIRQLAVQGNSSALSDADKRSVATQLRSLFEEFVGITNAKDANGKYLFSGFMGDTLPFSGSVDQLNGGGGMSYRTSIKDITYDGDQGQRTMQAWDARQIAVSDSGDNVFNGIKTGNGYFTTTYNDANTGSGRIDAGSILDQSKWNDAINKHPGIWATPSAAKVEVRFWVDTTGYGPDAAQGTADDGKVGATYYDIVDASTGESMIDNTNANSTIPTTYTRSYTPGQTIALNNLKGTYLALGNGTGDMGASALILGQPHTGDAFTITPAGEQSVFKTLAKLIGALEAGFTNNLPANDSAAAKLSTDVGSALACLSQAEDNVLRVRAEIGMRLDEVENNLAAIQQDVSLEYSKTISNLIDADYAETASNLARQSTGLQAAQQAYSITSKLSLFNYL